MANFYKKIRSTLLCGSFLLIYSTVEAQTTTCGQPVENFDNTAGSTAGFTGNFEFGTNGSDGFLVKDKVLDVAEYSITSPTYKLPMNATSVVYGFEVSGTERVSSIEILIQYISTVTNELITVPLQTFPNPAYDPQTGSTKICSSVQLSTLPGFPPNGNYRFIFEFGSRTGSGQVSQTIIFDDFITNGNRSEAALPVSFTAFNVKRNGSSVLVAWKIAGEENVDRYEVERSTDGRTFSRIASISRHGKDTYNYSDFTALETVFYRVRNVDKDGSFKYSTIARLSGSKSAIVLKSFPTPAVNFITLQHPSIVGKSLVTLATADGRIVKSVQPGTGSMQTTLEMNNLTKGFYLLRFTNENGETQTMKILKQ